MFEKQEGHLQEDRNLHALSTMCSVGWDTEGSPADKKCLKFNFEVIPLAFKMPWSIEKPMFQRALRQ